MTIFRQTAPEALRVSLRQQFTEGSPAPGVPPAELADLIIHAINEAFASVERVAMRAPSPEAQLAVYTISIAQAAVGFTALNDKTVATIIGGLATRSKEEAKS